MREFVFLCAVSLFTYAEFPNDIYIYNIALINTKVNYYSRREDL